MKRTDIEKKYIWQLEDIYPTVNDWEADLKKVNAMIDFKQYENKLNDKATLLQFLKRQDEVLIIFERVYSYAMMLHDSDMKNPEYDAILSKAHSLMVNFNAATSFVMPELTALEDQILLELVNDKDFSDYSYMLSTVINEKKHVLSKDVENILAMGGDIYSQFREIFMKIDNADFDAPEIDDGKGGKIKVTHGTYGVIMQSDDRQLRANAFKAYYQTYIKLINTITATYYGNVKKDVFSAKVRKYDSCLAAALSNEDVVPEVYTNLIQAVHKGLPIMHQYIQAKKDTLGYDEMHMYDMYTPIVREGEIALEYEEACKLVIEGLAPLGKEYEGLLKKAFTERWIDVWETDGKRSGAYSCGVYGVHPFVLLNYQPTTHAVFTIAHELGHSMHSYFSSKNQPYAKSDYRIFVAEVASTVNEMLLVMHLLKTVTDKKVKKFVLSYLMEMIRTTLFRQTQFAEFEYFAHKKAEEGEPLTTELLNSEYHKLNKEYYGDAIISDDEIAYEWARIPHFYRGFYVYKYATGIISAMAIVSRILNEGEPAVKDYFAFLSSGSSDNPVNLLKIAGVDLTKTDAFDSAMKLFADTLKEFNLL